MNKASKKGKLRSAESLWRNGKRKAGQVILGYGSGFQIRRVAGRRK